MTSDTDRGTLNSVTLDTLAGASVEEASSLTGELIGGILEVGDLLGKGGMGVVYQVFHREWNRQLAMKVPLALGDREGFDLKRWVREAHTWIDLGLHPRVVSCWFVRQWKGVPILFLDLFSGGSLKERLEKREGPPSTPAEWGEAITWLIHACEGLQHAHQMGLVHRDIKPANLLFNSEGTLAVTDFGLGKAISKASEGMETASLEEVMNSPDFSKPESSLTRTGVMSGTPHYAPPEQWMQKQVGPEADIYALAIVAYEVLTGRHPYEPPGERWTLGQLISAHLMGKPEPPNSFHSDVPAVLSEALVFCLAKKPLDRPKSPNELREVLIHAFKERTGRDYNFGLPQPLSQRADALNNKAVSLWSIGLRDEAVQAWAEADRLERNHLEVTYNKMITSWLTGRKSAQEAETAVRELATASVRGRSAAGMFMLCRGRYGEAISFLEESLESAMLTDDGTIWRGLGEAHMAVGEKEKAVTAFEKALSLIPTDQFSKRSVNKLEKSSEGSATKREGVLVRSNWRARGKLSDWFLMDSSQALVLLFGNKLVVASRDGKELVSLDLPLTTNSAQVIARNHHIFAIDGQQGWSMTVVNDGAWKLVHLRQWSQRGLGFVNPDTVLVGDTTLQLRARLDGSPLGPLLVGHEKQVLSFVVDPDRNLLLTGGADRVVRVWSMKDGSCEKEGKGHQNFVDCLVVGSQGQLVVSGDRSGIVLLWHMPQMEKLHRFDFPGSITSLHLKGHGREQTLFIVYVNEDDDTRTAVVFMDRLQVVMEKGGSFFDWGPGFGIWNERGFKLFSLPDGVEWRDERISEGIEDARFRPDRNELFYWNGEGDLVLYKLPATLPEPPSLPLVRANTLSEVQQARQQFANLMEAAWSSYREEDWSEAYWQLSRARLVEGYSREPETLELLSRLSKRLCRRELREMWRVRELTAPGGEHSSRMTLDFRGEWAATSAGHVIRLWDLKNGTCIRGLTGHRDEVVSLRFWDEGLGYGAAPLLLSFGADRTMRIWNPNSGECLKQSVVAEHPIISVGISDSSHLFSCVTRGGELKVGRWQGEDPFEIEMLASCEYEGIPDELHFSEDGKFVAVLEDQMTVFGLSEDLTSLKKLNQVPHYRGVPLSGGDGFLGVHPDGFLEKFRLRNLKKTHRMPGDVSRIQSLTVSSDRRVVAALDARDTLRFWLTGSEQCVLERPLTERLKRIRFSGNGRFLTGLADTGSLLIWELEWQLDPNRLAVEEPAEVEEPSKSMWGRFREKMGF